jgi:dolichol-phosphate mannosyltransferase
LAGLLAAAMLHVLPAYYGIGFVATMDSALLFFWMLGLVGITWALRNQRTWGWYVAGIALGGAMLSKYTGVFFAVGTMLAVIAHRPWRRHLLTIHPYLALLIGVAIFSPVIVWNARHDWASFRFQFVQRWGDQSISLQTFLAFVGYQLVILTPVLLAGLLAGFMRVIRKRRILQPRWLIAICFSLPLMLVAAHKSLRYGIHINWTAPLYASLLPAAAWWYLSHRRARRRSSAGFDWAPAVAWTVAICALINTGILMYLLALESRLRVWSIFGPWRELAAIVEHHEDKVEQASGREPVIVAAGKYRLASVLSFYRSPLEGGVRAADFTTSQWLVNGRQGLGFPYWANDRAWAGGSIIYVDDDGGLEEIQSKFRSVQMVYDSGNRFARRYQVAICQDFLQPHPLAPLESDR